MPLGRYSNTFITNLLNRAYVAKSRREQEARAVEHISLHFAPASGDTESSRENGSTAAPLERDVSAMVVYPAQKTLSPYERNTV